MGYMTYMRPGSIFSLRTIFVGFDPEINQFGPTDLLFPVPGALRTIYRQIQSASDFKAAASQMVHRLNKNKISIKNGKMLHMYRST